MRLNRQPLDQLLQHLHLGDDALDLVRIRAVIVVGRDAVADIFEQHAARQPQPPELLVEIAEAPPINV